MTLAQALGIEIRRATQEVHLPIEALAARADVSRSSIYGWLSGSRSIRVDNLSQVARVLNVTASALLARAEQRLIRSADESLQEVIRTKPLP